MSTKKFFTKSHDETQKIARDVAQAILASSPKSARRQTAVVLALQGDLGAGKTTFVQGFARALGVDEVVNSPTFIILKKFNVSQNVLQNLRPRKVYYKYFYHIDCYRLDKSEDIMHLGFKEIITNPENIVAIEWPEKISSLLPKENIISVNFGHGKGDTRTLTINM